MTKVTNRALATAFAVALVFGSGTLALADRGGNGNGHGNPHANSHATAHMKASAHGSSSTKTHGSSAVHGNSAIHTNSTMRGNSSSHTYRNSNSVNPPVNSSSRTRGNSATAHSCVNPAGNTRGWCKSQTGSDFMTGTVTSINGNVATVMLSNGQSVTVNANGLTVGQQITLRGSFQNGVFVPNGSPLSNYGGPYSSASVRGMIISVSGNTIQIVQGLSLISIDASNAISRGAVNGTLIPGRTITAYGNWNGSTFIATSIQ